MITLRELLTDSVYKKYFLTPPQPVAHHPLAAPPWRVYVQKRAEGPWAKKDFLTYIEAFKFLRKYLSNSYDATIQSKGVAYPAPTRWVKVTRNGHPVIITTADGTKRQKTKEIQWLPKLPEGEPNHFWCTYCRRPTIFTWFSTHHAFGKHGTFDPSVTRCTICGASERLVLWNAHH